MPFFESHSAPDLGHLFELIANYTLNVTFLDRGGHDNVQVRALIHAYLRSVDKAVRAYRSGRSFLNKHAQASGDVLLLLRAMDDFETCVAATRRALALAGHMARHKENPEINQVTRKLLKSYEQGAVTKIRNATEHMDEDIMRAVSPTGSPLSLAPSRDGERLEIGDHSISFVRLAQCLESLHALGGHLAQRDRGGARELTAKSPRQ